MSNPPILHPLVQVWITQLTDPALLRVLELNPERVDIKLSASKGKVRRRPEITFDGGSMEFTPP